MNNENSPNGNCEARFIERVGQLFETDGMSRIAGRILGHLLLRSEPQSQDALAEALQVSKASVSSNTRALEAAGAIVRVTLPGDRRDYYVMGDSLHARMLERRVRWLRSLVQLLEEGCAIEPAGDERVRARIQDMRTFFQHMIEAILATQERWEREREGVEE